MGVSFLWLSIGTQYVDVSFSNTRFIPLSNSPLRMSATISGFAQDVPDSFSSKEMRVDPVILSFYSPSKVFSTARLTKAEPANRPMI